MAKNLPANAEDTVDMGSIPGSGRSPGAGNGNPLQYSCLENPLDRGAWCATVFGVTKNQTLQATEHATNKDLLYNKGKSTRYFVITKKAKNLTESLRYTPETNTIL